MFEPRTRALEADAIHYTPFRDLFRETNGPDDAVWRDRVNQYIDLNYLVKYIAVESFLGEYDGFAGNYGMNNFYMYRRDGVHTVPDPALGSRQRDAVRGHADLLSRR